MRIYLRSTDYYERRQRPKLAGEQPFPCEGEDKYGLPCDLEDEDHNKNHLYEAFVDYDFVYLDEVFNELLGDPGNKWVLEREWREGKYKDSFVLEFYNGYRE